MQNEQAINLFNAIKKDDLNLFSSLIKNNQDFCYGRFPILSLCYLFNSKKIIRKFEKNLLAVKSYKIVDEPFEIFKKFRVVAGRCLRFYLNEQIVEPIEMLAILGKDFKVKKLIKINKLKDKPIKNVQKSTLLTNKLKKTKQRINLEISQESINNLNSIYLIKSQDINIKSQEEIKTKKVVITKKPFSLYQKNLHKMAMIVSGCFVVILGLFYLLSYFVSGLGIKNSPFFIYNQSQLIMALKSGGNYELKEDITLNSNFSLSNFNGNFNGNNFTIYVNNFNNKGLIDNNLGTIKNLNISFSKINGEVSQSVSLLCKTNSGEINNVNIVSEELTLTCNKSAEDILLSGFTNKNLGTISNCNLQTKVNITTNGDGECNFAGFANVNSGSVTNCNFTTSQVETKDCDASGIVCTNNFSAVVSGCKNYASINQESYLDKWSPNVAGVALNNNGVIKNCYNFGTLKVNSLATLEDDGRAVFLGGITAVNCGEIDKCLNKGDITITSKARVVYSGGITGQTSYFVNEAELIVYTPKINNCGVDCNIDIQTENEKAYVYSGGINGFLSDRVGISSYVAGEIKNCYSLAKISVNSEEENKKYYNGSFIGLSQWYVVYLRLSASNNFVLNTENGIYQVGGALVMGEFRMFAEDILNDTAVKHTTREEILQSGVYWNE